MYNIQYFIDKFSAIPEEKWICGHLGNATIGRCAYGHCGGYYTAEAKALSHIFIPLKEGHGTDGGIRINDGYTARYLHLNHPKHRILAALWDIQKGERRLVPVEISDPPITGEELITQLETPVYETV